MRIDLFTIFPAELEAMARLSILGRARDAGHLDIRCVDLRSETTDPHRSVDDAPFGGGPGMVLRADTTFAAVRAAAPPRPLLLLDAGGRTFDQSMAHELAALDGFSLLCGRYEGVDDRIRTHLVDGEVSVGDYVLAGGEFAAMVIVEAVARLRSGVLGNDESVVAETFATGLLEHPQFTRPADVDGLGVPAELTSGDHARVARWRHAAALVRTARLRPDLLRRRGLTDADRAALAEFGCELPSLSGRSEHQRR